MNESDTHVVLVHAAWHGGWSWGDVPGLLKSKGYTVSVIDQLPSTKGGTPADLAADAAAVREVIAGSSKPVVLVGQSYGGMVVSELAGVPNVRAAAYVGAFAPPQAGLNLLDLAGGVLPPWIIVDETGAFCTVEPVMAAQLMASNAASPEAAREHVARMVAQSVAAFASPSTTSGWGSVPTYYLVTAKDEVIPPEGQHAMAGALGATVSTIDGPHIPQVSDPQGVADFIAQAAVGG
jgi:pimeloyl-ACP methyl ester carboxylesterase